MHKNRLIVHIGTPKTGTSSLQRFLHINSSILEKVGWSYSFFDERTEEERMLLSRNGDIFVKEWFLLDTTGCTWNDSWVKIEKALEKFNVILSCEDIYMWQTEELLGEIKKRYDNVQVIVYIRRQDLFLESWWNQSVKAETYIDDTFFEFVRKHYNDIEYRYYDKLQQISDIIGKENVIVRLFEKESFSGYSKDVISDFFDALNINVNLEEMEKVERVNERISGQLLHIKRVINQIDKEYTNLQSLHCTNTLKLASLIEGGMKNEGYFEPDDRKKILEYYAEQNEKLAKEYFGRKDAKLFEEPDYSIDVNKNELSAKDEEMIKVIMFMMNDQYTRIMNGLKEHEDNMLLLAGQNQILMEDMIRRSLNGRKIVIFGAGEKCRQMFKYISLPVELIVDNDIKKNGMIISGINIVHSSHIKEWKKYFVIISCLEPKEIEKQLESYGLCKGEDYIPAREYFGLLNKINL